MVHNDFQFIEVKRIDPDKLPSDIRKDSFAEIYQPLKPQQAHSQSDRCLDCGNPYCQWKCPVHNYIPQWLELAKQGKISEAVELCHQTNSLPEVCGRVCPQDRLCEGACTLNDDFGAVTIGSMEKYIVDKAFELGWRPDLSAVLPMNKTVAVVGAGPAGLACADVLIRNGVNPVVFDKNLEIGGLLTFGIPEFKLEKSVMRRRREIFESMGIEFRLGVELGKDITMDELIDQYDAVFLGLGAYKPLGLNLPECEDTEVNQSLPYLIDNTNHIHQFSTNHADFADMKGKSVVVLGGGDTAMDCVRTAVRQGAEKVICAYRRDRDNMPGSDREVTNAMEEGVEFMWYVQPMGLRVDEDKKVTGLTLVKTQLGEPDENGRRRPENIPDSEFTLDVDAVIVAFGFQPEKPDWLAAAGVGFNRWNQVEASEQSEYPMQTAHPKVFAGGDMVRGADLVVTAIAQGRKAAEGMVKMFEQA
jgi:glutamate synthase (NADPH/NADH) small chain